MESTDDAIPMKVSSCFRKIELPSGLDTQFCNLFHLFNLQSFLGFSLLKQVAGNLCHKQSQETPLEEVVYVQHTVVF